MPEGSSSPSPTPTPTTPTSPNPLKRKVRSEEEDPDSRPPQKPFNAANPLPPGANARPDEYAAGFITCETCGTDVSFRDDSNGFTLKHWDAHRLICSTSAPVAATGAPVIYVPDSATDALTHPPTKRRRAKRTEEERIDYLRQDPYVGQFEAYRVLCASCDKWIRLRPNSTYCSIPWDAHRKSCLAKKINNKNVYALEERNTLFSKDPDVRKFDPERLLCNMCDKWLSVPPDDHLQAVQKWLQHRASCQRTTASSSSAALPHLETSGLPDGHPQQSSASRDHRGSFSSHPSSPKAPDHPAASNTSRTPPGAHNIPIHPRFTPLSGVALSGSPSFHDLNPSNYAPAHESRRRNAEQRAATLRADRLIGEVEPNRVFCSLCKKWVQLRQDSSYCAYPWLQHRGKCLARHQRRTQKAADMADVKARKMHMPAQHEEDELLSDREATTVAHRSVVRDGSEDPESEDGVESGEEERFRRKESKSRLEHRHYHVSGPSSTSMGSRQHYGLHSSHHAQHHQSQHQPHMYKSRSAPYNSSSSGQRYAGAGSMSQAVSSGYRHDSRPGPSHHAAQSHSQAHSSHQPRRRPSWDDDLDLDVDADADADADAEGEDLDEEKRISPHSPPIPTAGSSRPAAAVRVPQRRPWPVGLADLDSPSGRKQFIFGSVEYLFATTYESTDDMSISALLAYLNAAMPQDKHEDFDTTEVARAVASMKEKGRIIFEGDILRLID